MKSNKNIDDFCLLGEFFHSINKDTGNIEWQGIVIRRPEVGWYLIELFEWFTGTPNVRRLVRIEDMTEWLFYPNVEAMKFSYENGIARKGGRYRKEED
jgi:hypothetical protein